MPKSDLEKILSENSDAASGLAKSNVASERSESMDKFHANVAEAMGSMSDKGIKIDSLVIEAKDAKGELKYYKATIDKGSYESGNLEFGVKTIDKTEYDKTCEDMPMGCARMTYDKSKHNFEIYTKDKDSNEIMFSQGELFASTLDHIKQGMQAALGGTYDMEGIMHEGKNNWKIEFGTDIKYNVKYMKMQRQ